MGSGERQELDIRIAQDGSCKGTDVPAGERGVWARPQVSACVSSGFGAT